MRSEIDDRLAGLLGELSLYLLRAGSPDAAERALEALEALERGSARAPQTAFLRGYIAFAKGRFSEAEACYRRHLDRVDGDDLARAFLAESLLVQRRWREAESLLETVRRANRDARAVALAASLDQGHREGVYRRALATAGGLD